MTAIGRVTSPPAAKGPPVGHILYMEADQPSEHTSLLRGLRELAPDGTERELVHETEPQDVDAGTRTWINQPCGSPDGRWVAYEVQNITIGEEKQSVTYQLWVLPLRAPGKPRLLLDITKAGLKPFVGLTWTPDSRQIVFLNDATALGVDVHTGAVSSRPLRHQPFPVTAGASATRNPAVFGPGSPRFATFGYLSTNELEIINALSPDRARVAGTVTWKTHASTDNKLLNITDAKTSANVNIYPLHWGWSVWGGRHITNLRWSPNGRYVAYSVSKPPFENELFYVDIATGKCRQLPVRTGPSAWDWVP